MPLPFVPRTLSAIAAIITALWISICAAAPEFIWQGLYLAVAHLNVTDLMSALLIGLVLAFFVEPVLERLRHAMQSPQHRRHGDGSSHGPLFTTGLSLAFAFTSISLHEAMTAFASGKGADHGAADVGLAAGIELTTSWAIVPFAIAIAWLTLRIRWLAIPAGMIAAASSWFTAWLFAWPVESAITTTIPCLVIQALGYHHLSRIPTERGLDRCARIVAIVGTVWLLVALVFDAAVPLLRGQPFQLYDSPSFWMDVRFYFGWAIGLMVAPSPYRRTEPV